MGALSPGSQPARELQTPGVLITENLHEGKHLYTKLDITHLLTVSTAGHFTQKTSKTKTQSNHQQTGVPQTLQNIPPQIAPPIKKKKQKTKKKNLFSLEHRHKNL